MTKLLVCTTPNRGGCELTEGKKYEFVKVQHGIFETGPYVTVKEQDSDKKISCHFYRFHDDMDFLKAEYKKLKEAQPFQR